MTKKKLPAAEPKTAFDPPAEAQWHQMISECAYFIAEKRGFKSADTLADWLEAEAIVKEALQQRPASK